MYGAAAEQESVLHVRSTAAAFNDWVEIGRLRAHRGWQMTAQTCQHQAPRQLCANSAHCNYRRS